jgi:hypothetical protein
MTQLLPASYIQAKNSLHNSLPMLILLQWTVDDESVNFACNNSEDVIWNGQIWIPMPVNIGPRRFARNELPQMSIEVADPDSLVHAKVEEYAGAEDSQIDIYYVYYGDLTQVDNVPHFIFENVGCRIKAPYVYFTLGIKDDPSQIKDPVSKILKNHCNFRFHNSNDSRCPYTGSDFTDCDFTLTDCKERNGVLATQFGGFPSIGTNRIYV